MHFSAPSSLTGVLENPDILNINGISLSRFTESELSHSIVVLSWWDRDLDSLRPPGHDFKNRFHLSISSYSTNNSFMFKRCRGILWSLFQCIPHQCGEPGWQSVLRPQPSSLGGMNRQELHGTHVHITTIIPSGLFTPEPAALTKWPWCSLPFDSPVSKGWRCDQENPLLSHLPPQFHQCRVRWVNRVPWNCLLP